jgi:hypothetical protein
MADSDYAQCMEIVEAVMEWIARRWTKSMIKAELRDWFPGMSSFACGFIISAARKEIRKRYNIDPAEYKGRQIEFYESIIRSKTKVRDKLSAAERIDKLLGLEHIVNDNPDAVAAKIRAAINEMDSSIGATNGKESQNEGDSKVNAKSSTESNEPLRSEEPAKEKEIINEEDIVFPIDISEIPKDALINFAANQRKKRA